jgi:hypothetical protein
MSSPSSYVRRQTLATDQQYRTLIASPSSHIVSRSYTYVKQPKDYSKVSSKVKGNMKSQKQARLRELPERGFNTSLDFATQRRANRSYYAHHADQVFDDSRDHN